MAGSYNKISIIGNVGRDPETRQLASGDNVASFTVATTERNKNSDVTTWFRVSAFAQLADVCQKYLRKGSYIYIEGSLTQREYTDRDGATRQSLDCAPARCACSTRPARAGPAGAASATSSRARAKGRAARAPPGRSRGRAPRQATAWTRYPFNRIHNRCAGTEEPSCPGAYRQRPARRETCL